MSKALFQDPMASSRKPWIQVGSEPVSRQLREVFRTYTTRWEWWMLAASWLVLMLANALAPYSIRLVLVLLIFPYANAMLGILLGLLLKLQFGDWRARLLPGFAAAHLTVAAAIVAVAVSLESSAIAFGANVSGWAVAGLALMVIAATAWCVHLFSMRSFLLIAGLPALAMAVARQHVIGPMQAAILGNNPTLSWATVGLGVTALAGLGARLWRLSEEMPEYSRRIPATVWDATSRAGRRDQQRWEAQVLAKSRLQGWFSDLQFRLTLPWTAQRTAWSRLLLRQLAGGYSWIFLAPSQLVFVLFPLGAFLSQEAEGKVDVLTSPLPWVMIMPVLFAMAVLTAVWLERWPYVMHEVLHPLSRADFVRDLVRSSACDTLGLALGHGVGIAVGLVWFASGPLIALLLPSLAIMAMQYVVLFGLMLWLASFRCYGMATLGIMLASLLSGALAVAALLVHDWFWMPWVLAGAGAVAAMAGVGLYRAAFRRWCEVDLV